MIAQLTGDIIHTNPPQIILQVGGIGYEVLCPLNTFYALNQTKHTVYTQLIVREDAHTLYGFNTLDEKIIFNELIKVNGVGAKVALAILSTLSVGDVLTCVADDQVNLLQKTPGIGKKTAQKLIVELKDRLPKLTLSKSYQSNKSSLLNQNQTSIDIAINALQSLGFKAKEAENMLSQIDHSLSVDQIIHLALKNK